MYVYLPIIHSLYLLSICISIYLSIDLSFCLYIPFVPSFSYLFSPSSCSCSFSSFPSSSSFTSVLSSFPLSHSAIPPLLSPSFRSTLPSASLTFFQYHFATEENYSIVEPASLTQYRSIFLPAGWTHSPDTHPSFSSLSRHTLLFTLNFVRQPVK